MVGVVVTRLCAKTCSANPCNYGEKYGAKTTACTCTEDLLDQPLHPITVLLGFVVVDMLLWNSIL